MAEEQLVINSYPYAFLARVEDTVREIRTTAGPALERAIQILFDAWKDGRFVYIMGNGGSASTATHLAADLAKTIVSRPEERGIRALPMSDNIPLVSALVNDWGWENLYSAQLATYWMEGGVGIGISVHGGSGKDLAGAWSQNLMKGLQYIKDRGGKTIGLSGFDGGPMKDLVDAAIVVPANSTPLVEGLHVVLHHLLVFGLKEKIHAFRESGRLS